MPERWRGYLAAVVDEVRRDLREALKAVAVALKEGGAPFALAGGYALWARGAPEPEHDVDFLIAEDDAPAVMERLAGLGFHVVQPPEDWLFKVYVGDALVDLLFRMNSDGVRRGDLEEADVLEVESVAMPVLSATQLMTGKLNAMEEHACDFGAVLPIARAVREQVDWGQVADGTKESPYAAAFLFLLERLGIIS